MTSKCNETFANKSLLRTIILVAILCLLPFSLALAVKPDTFVEHLSEQIYNDCANSALVLKGDSILGIAVINDPRIKNLRPRPETISTEPTMLNIEKLISTLSQHEPYIEYSNYPDDPAVESPFYGEKRIYTTDDGEKTEFSNSALGILYCGDKKLDITGYQYFWRGELVDVPKVENKYNLSLFGFSVIQNGGVTIVGVTIFSLSVFSLTAISLTIIAIRKIIIRKRERGE